MICTRPDLAYAVGKLSHHTHNPAVRHQTELDHMLRYLVGIVDLALVFDHNNNGDLVSFADAAYGNDVINQKSTYSHTFLLGNGAVIWASKKQQSVITSIMEAEYSLMCQASKNIILVTRWMNKLNFGKNMNLPIVLHDNNQGTLDLIKNPEHYSRSKHINVQLHYLRKAINDGHATTAYVSTCKMIIFSSSL